MPKREPKARLADSREKLLEAVCEIMASRNSPDVSLGEIGARSGVNPSLVKYHFGNKAGLMLEALRKALHPGLRQIDHLLRVDLPADKKLGIHISGVIASYAAHPYINRLMSALINEDESYGKLVAEEFAAPLKQLQQGILEQGIEQGIFRPVDPGFLYVSIVGACDHLFFARHQLKYLFGFVLPDDGLQRQFAAYLFDMVLKGIAVRETAAVGCATGLMPPGGET